MPFGDFGPSIAPSDGGKYDRTFVGFLTFLGPPIPMVSSDGFVRMVIAARGKDAYTLLLSRTTTLSHRCSAMPQYIQRFCGTHVNSMELQFKLARMKVRTGALALGENHTEPYARAVIGDLIEARCGVTKLFLELPEYGDIGKSLRNDLLGTDISKNTEWAAVERAINRETRGNNPIRETKLIRLAVASRVKVYFFDDYRGPNGQTSEIMQMRNRNMGDVFANKAAATKPGAILLVGGKHLQPQFSGGHFQHTIQSTCGISPLQAIDLRDAGKTLIKH